jgi:hypothetical protein
LGRVTKSFRQRFREEIKHLEEFKDLLNDPTRREAVDLIKYAASSELGALHYSQILTALDGIKICGLLDNRKVITEILEYCKQLEIDIEDLKLQIDRIKDITEDKYFSACQNLRSDVQNAKQS